MAISTEAMSEMEEKQQRYIERVNDLFTQIKTWLPKDLTTVDIPRTIQDETGEYDAFGLALVKKNMPEPDDAVADLFPQGCSALLAEGMIDLDGPYGTVSIVYLEKSKVLWLPRDGKSRPIFNGVEHDGWYWLEDPLSSRMLPMNAALLLELLEMVSGQL